MRIAFGHVDRTDTERGPVIRLSASRSFFLTLLALGIAGGIGFALIPTAETSLLMAVIVGAGIMVFAFSLVGGFGLGLGWVQIGPAGISGTTNGGHRLVPWREARFVEWIPGKGGPPFGGWTRPALAVYRERFSESGPVGDERLLLVRLRLIVTRRQEVAIARELLETCRRFGSTTSVKHFVGHGLVDEAKWREIEK